MKNSHTKMSLLYCLLWPGGQHSPRNTKYVGSNPGTGRYIVARMSTQNGGPLSLDLILSGRLKNLRDVDKWSSQSLCLSVEGCRALEGLGCTCAVRIYQQYFESCGIRDIALSINIQLSIIGFQ